MKALNLIMATVLAFTLVGCGSDGGSSGAGGSSIISGIFSDASVTSFTQTGGVAKVQPGPGQKIMNFVVPTAYAVDGNISCISGDSVSFQLDALGNTVNVSTTCTSLTAMDLAIRVGLLESLDGRSIKRTVTDASYKDGALNFVGGLNWDTDYSVRSINDANGDTTVGDRCYDYYKFVQSTGKLEIRPDTANSDGNCLCVTTPGHADCATDTVSFRFVNGYLELDLTNSDNFDSSAVTYEKWETCTLNTDCYTDF